MITIKTAEDIAKMRSAGKIVGDLLKLLEDKVKVGVTTKKLDDIAYDFITRHNATPSFLNYNGYPASICVSIDEEVVHGIPSDKRYIEEGQIVSIDAGAYLNGWHGDAARTFVVGKTTSERQKLVDVTKECFFKGVEQFTSGNRLGDISNAVQLHAESNGFSVVRALVGHGIGRQMHEDPSVPNYGRAGFGVRLEKGMALAIEPMINLGGFDVRTLSDGWTVVTRDSLPSAHYENTVVLTENGIEILTL